MTFVEADAQSTCSLPEMLWVQEWPPPTPASEAFATQRSSVQGVREVGSRRMHFELRLKQRLIALLPEPTPVRVMDQQRATFTAETRRAATDDCGKYELVLPRAGL